LLSFTEHGTETLNLRVLASYLRVLAGDNLRYLRIFASDNALPFFTFNFSGVLQSRCFIMTGICTQTFYLTKFV
jgi:hypothetical protein